MFLLVYIFRTTYRYKRHTKKMMWIYKKKSIESEQNDSINYINGVPDECCGRRRSRRDDTLKGKMMSVQVKAEWFQRLQVVSMWFPYDSKPLVNSGSIFMTFPLSSTGGLMSKAAIIPHVIKNNELSLKYLPGQILGRVKMLSEMSL